MGPTGDTHRILQIHPSRRCNLRCLHCYSASGPEVSETLELSLLRSAISDAGREGFNVVGVSGGEPLLYPGLAALLEHAHENAMTTTVTTNGMLLDAAHLKLLVGRTDLLAISLDGLPASHNRMRANPRAFETMRSQLQRLRDTGLTFGFIFTLTQYNVHELEWVVHFALDAGARLLQIHPLAEVGRARIKLSGSGPDWLESSYAYLEAARLQGTAGDRMYVQLDLAHREALLRQPERIFAGQPSLEAANLPLAHLISPLVIETDGTLVPLEYGFPRSYALGNLHESSFGALAAHWKTTGVAQFFELCRGVYDKLEKDTDASFVNWYGAVNQAGQGAP